MISTVRRLGVLGLPLSIFLVVALAFPWGDLVGHSHWSRVDWIPFVTRRVRLSDVAANLLLCAPLGSAAGLTFRRGAMAAGILTLLVSAFVEWTQVYSHLRFPSMTDIVCNVAGAMAAAALVNRFVRRRLTSRPQ
jgi:glycopeptide antibiotics resistance protein